MKDLIFTTIGAKKAVSKAENENPAIGLFSKMGELFENTMEDKE